MNPIYSRLKAQLQLGIVCGAVLMLAPLAPAKEFLVYFGTYTNALSRGIYVSRLDADTGKLSAPELAAAVGNPCFVNLSPDGKSLYSANSVKSFNGENAGSISAFAIDKKSGQLTLLNEKSSGGAGPCHVSVDASGKVLFTANYGGGSVKTFLLESNGSLGTDGSTIQHHGHSVNTNRQTAPHAHFICADPSNRFALACDLGTDSIMVYPFATVSAGLAQRGAANGSVPPGSGARHLAFSRDGKFVYVLNEMACTVSQFAWGEKSGALKLLETISALPADVELSKAFSAAEILVHPSGKYIYATLRGHDSVSVFAADTKSGKLTFVQNISSGGKVPRGLGIDPTGRWLITAHQKSDNALEFAIDAATGKLSPTGQELKIGSPVDVKFVAAE
ncbi:MAG: 6-phosphogluconolactonase [Verrucomicrobiota bacterium]